MRKTLPAIRYKRSNTLTGIRSERILLSMIFEWHDAKHEWTLRERGFGFDFAALIFEGRILTQIDDRQDYGEIRIKAIGEVDGVILVVIYTDREDVRWIISARIANKKERALWLV